MIKCPYCGKSHFRVNASSSTLIAVPLIISDGKVQEGFNPNITTHYCTCLECHKDFETHEDILNKDGSPILCNEENNTISLNGDIMNKTIKQDNKNDNHLGKSKSIADKVDKGSILKDKEYIDFGVATYALPDVLLALYNEGITQCWVTKEDNELHIRIEKDYLREKVYKVKFRPLDEEKKDTPISPSFPFISPTDDNLRFNQASQPNCDTCPYKGGLKDAFGNPVIGDSPCDFCPSNPTRVICSSDTNDSIEQLKNHTEAKKFVDNLQKNKEK